jgi:hypothetical protein
MRQAMWEQAIIAANFDSRVALDRHSLDYLIDELKPGKPLGMEKLD